MTYYSSFLLIFSVTLFTIGQAASPITLTVFNNCPYTVWPAIQPNAGMEVLQKGGFALDRNSHVSFPAPDSPWAGRIWARTLCAEKDGKFSCSTGDCGPNLECNGKGGEIATLAELNLRQKGPDDVDYRVSLVDGYNLPVTVTPHEGTGQCPVVGCTASLLESCPDDLLLRDPVVGKFVGCQSGCKALGRPELCCTGDFNTPDKCKPSSQSEFFKKACPNVITYPLDQPSIIPSCTAPKELKVIFCQ